MKILIIYQYFGTPAGSWSTRVYEFSRRWVDEGHKVKVVTCPYEKSDISGSGFVSKTIIDGINLTVINTADSNRNSVLKRVLNALIFAISSSWIALFENYDLILASSGPITVGLPMILAKKVRNKKTVFEVRDLWPAGGIEMGKIKRKWQQNLAKWFEKKCYTNADKIITASTGQSLNIKTRFKDVFPVTISQSSDTELFSRKDPNFILPEWAQTKHLFLHIGSLGLIHNIGFIVDVASKHNKCFNDQNITIVLIGEGAERKMLENKVEKEGINTIKFLGLLPKLEVVNWLQYCSATLFTTLNNPVQDTCSPNKIFDSFAAGKPIIQTSSGWIKALVEKERCGINVAPGDVKGFAEAMKVLSMDDSKVAELGANAARLANGEFNRDYLAEKYLNELTNI